MKIDSILNHAALIVGLAITITLVSSSAQAAVLAGWDTHPLSGGSGNFGASPLPPTDADPNLTVVGLTRGSGVGTSGSGAARGWGGNNWGQAAKADAVSANQFATFSVTANTGYTVSFSGISQFSYRRSGTGPSTGVLQYQIGTGSFTDVATLAYTSSSSSGSTLAPVDLSGITALQNIAAGTVVTFRIVNYGATGTSGTWYVFDQANTTADDLQIQGTVLPVGSAPTITVQPVSQTAFPNGSAQFALTAAGQSLSYQWYRFDGVSTYTRLNDGAQSSGAQFSGTKTNIFAIANAQYAAATNFVAVITNSYGAVTSSVVSLTVTNVTALGFWNFNGNFNILNPAPYQGAGTALALNCQTFSQPTQDGLDTTGGGTNYGWGTQSYPTQGTSNKLAGVQFNVSTLGARNIQVSFDTRSTTTASKYERLQYTTNGTDFVDYPTSSSFVSAGLYESRSFSLKGFPGVQNNPSFGIRIVTEFESTASYGTSSSLNYTPVSAAQYGTSGTLSYDLVTITGEAITNANTPPFIGALSAQTASADKPATLNFTVGDNETPAGSLTVSATSLNQSVLGDSALVLGGSGSARTLTITPDASASGAAPVLVTVVDASGDSAVGWFLVTVTPANLPPTLAGLSNVVTLANTPVTLAFTMGDDATPADSLTVAGASGNQSLVPNENISFGGAGSNRTVTLVPARGQLGIAPLSVTVNDNNPSSSKTTTLNFNLVVRPNTNVVFVDYFNYDNSGAIVSASAGAWQSHSGIAGQMQAGSGQVTVDGLDNTEDVNALLLGQPYSKTGEAVLYSSFILNVSMLPTDAGTYFGHFKDNTTSGFLGRLFLTTSNATPGSYRLSIANNAGTSTAAVQFPVDLNLDTSYVVVTRLVVSNGVSTLWVNPAGESSASVTDTTKVSSPLDIYAFALRESTGEGIMTLSKLKVGLSFDSVAPSLRIQPLDGTRFVLDCSDPTLNLQSSPDVSGQYEDIPDASLPCTNSYTGSQMFFRLR